MSSNYRQRIESRFEALGHLVYRHHWKALALVLVIVVTFVSQLPKLTMDTSTEGFLHDDDNTLEVYDAFRDQFGHDEMVFIAIESKEIFSQTFLKKLQSLHQELENELPYLDDITSLINARSTRGAEGELIVEDLLENWPQDAAATGGREGGRHGQPALPRHDALCRWQHHHHRFKDRHL